VKYPAQNADLIADLVDITVKLFGKPDRCTPWAEGQTAAAKADRFKGDPSQTNELRIDSRSLASAASTPNAL
jgi:hypothetical protein